MAKAPILAIDPTLDAMWSAFKAAHDAESEQRGYVGGSAIGKDCGRALWYSFRWAAEPDFSPATLAKFADGHAGEAELAKRLRLIPGVTLDTHDENGNQHRVHSFGGHFSIAPDGAIDGLKHAEGFHIWEAKITEKLTALRKAVETVGELNALAKWNFQYYVQAQIAMGDFGVHQHYLTAGSPGVREVVGVRTLFDQATYDRYKARALTIIETAEPLPRIGLDATEFPCSFCEHAKHCHGEIAPAMNCRMCVHGTPVIDDTPDGKWTCELHGEIDGATMRKGCEDHLFIPALLAFADPTDSGLDYVEYRMRYPANERAATFRNGANGYTSTELANTPASLIGNPMTEELRKGGAVWISAKKETA